MNTTNGSLIKMEDIKKVFRADEVETHALSGIYLDIKPCSLSWGCWIHRRAEAIP